MLIVTAWVNCHRREHAVRETLFRTAAWIAAHHVKHFEAWKQLSMTIGARVMRLADPRRYAYVEATLGQHLELQELKALSAALDIKQLASSGEGWEDHHSIGLDMVANVLILQHDWEPDDVNEFIEELTDGVFSYGASEDGID